MLTDPQAELLAQSQRFCRLRHDNAFMPWPTNSLAPKRLAVCFLSPLKSHESPTRLTNWPQSRRYKQQTASIPRKLPDSEIPPLNLNAGHTILGSVEILVALVIRQNDFSNLLCGIALIGAIACNH